MDTQNTSRQLRYLEEVRVSLHRAGFGTLPLEGAQLPVLWNGAPLCRITGFASGYYMYFRKVFNDIRLGRIADQSIQCQAANFYFIREYCYGSMFRFNAKGEFNIPYSGMSYNRKDMRSKIDGMFNREMEALFAKTDIHCCDFEELLSKVKLSEKDFMFLDPPYDTDFSDYDGVNFTKFDQERLAYVLKKTLARFILVIKNTDFIRGLYEKDFHILSFDKRYTYNVRSRNNRDAKHLIITNLPVSDREVRLLFSRQRHCIIAVALLSHHSIVPCLPSRPLF